MLKTRSFGIWRTFKVFTTTLKRVLNSIKSDRYIIEVVEEAASEKSPSFELNG
jgi:hypothetical protein